MATALKDDIIKLINGNDDTIVNIKNILQPISQFIDNPIISQNVGDIITIMLTDRDNSGKFDVNDLKVLSNDPFVIMHLVTLLLLILTALPTLKITVDINESEIIIFKLLMYIFLVIIPAKVATNWSLEDKLTLLDLSLLIFQMMQSSEMVKNGINKIASYIKTNKYCSCLTVKTDIIGEKVPDAKIEFAKAVYNAKGKVLMQTQIDRLQKLVIQ